MSTPLREARTTFCRNLHRRASLGAAALLMMVWPARAEPPVVCAVEQGGDELQMPVPVARDALEGAWREFRHFRFRAVLASPPSLAPWLLVEVHARHDDGDLRLLSSQRTGVPFATGHVEVVQPGMGRSLRYRCERAG